VMKNLDFKYSKLTLNPRIFSKYHVR